MHVPLLKLPPAPPSLHDTFPVAVVGELEVSVTVALNFIVFPSTTDDGFGVTAVLVGSHLFIT